jgi:hypothetical protein
MGPTSGIEPLTPALQVRCATNCATSAYSELLANYVRSDGYLRPAVNSADSQTNAAVLPHQLLRHHGAAECCALQALAGDLGACRPSSDPVQSAVPIPHTNQSQGLPCALEVRQSAARGVSTNGPHHQHQPLEVYPPTVHITNVSRSRCIHQRSTSPTSAAWGNKSISARRNRTCLRRRSVEGLTLP